VLPLRVDEAWQERSLVVGFRKSDADRHTSSSRVVAQLRVEAAAWDDFIGNVYRVADWYCQAKGPRQPPRDDIHRLKEKEGKKLPAGLLVTTLRMHVRYCACMPDPGICSGKSRISAGRPRASNVARLVGLSSGFALGAKLGKGLAVLSREAQAARRSSNLGKVFDGTEGALVVLLASFPGLMGDYWIEEAVHQHAKRPCRSSVLTQLDV
jgi:hypothetical protein